MNNFDVTPLLPELLVAVAAMAFLIIGVVQGNRSTTVLSIASCFVMVAAASLLMNGDGGTQKIMNNMLVFDQFAFAAKLLILTGLMASLALSVQYIRQERIARFEYPVLVMLAGVGMMLMVSAHNFLSLYMALELQSLSLYVLAAFHRNSLRSAEAAAKYFILGALSSGMLLFGISLIYGFTGSLDFDAVQAALKGQSMIPPGFIVGMVFVLAAMAFKISAAPFHMWTPDVYQGAPTSVTAFFAIVPKVAAVALLMRLTYGAFAPAQVQWVQILTFMSVASMVVGSFAAIAQKSIKRLLAYSSIGNMGYVLIGIIAGTPQGVGAVLLFLTIYIFATAGIFAIVLHMRRDGIALEKISDLSGLSRHSPLLAYAMAILMFSVAGIPPMAGFFGKMVVFQAAVQQGYFALAVIGILTSVVAAYYYLRIIKVMFFDEPVDPFDQGMGLASRIVLLVSVIFTLLYIADPSLIYDSLMLAAKSLFTGI